ncbi:SAYSvFN domain-containing protein 1-like [Lytechinus variegatus]|uniref:SAYSvFN domain-containing protein 1-like n=1 Tax=Lytechinus variegatus TaxID=7654 RepID=UPI001BB2A406|nr:SAYSvFN domain-containing protein 1-like [Lytechinus variegatus]
MEKQLAAYRAKKAKERTSNSGGLFGGGLFFRNRKEDASSQPQNVTEKDTSQSLKSQQQVNENIKGGEKRDDDTSLNKDDGNSTDTKTDVTLQSFSNQPYSTSTIDPFQLALKIILWLALFGLSICIGFGAIYIILSFFYIIYANLRGEGEKKPGEKSAYSVFNPKCERIHGTLTAEEIERGMLYGIGGAMR